MSVREDLIAKVKRRLGDGMVNVELTEAQLGDAVDEALELYNVFIPRKIYFPLACSSSNTRYDLSGSTYNDIQNVVAVQYVPQGQQSTFYSSFYESSGLPIANFPDFGLSLQAMREQFQVSEILFDAVPDFVFDIDNRILYLKTPIGATEVILVCAARASLSQVRYNLASLFLDGCVAYAKEMLGIVRRKYQGATLPGGEVNLDGMELSNEAKDEKDAYEKKLLSYTSDIIVKA